MDTGQIESTCGGTFVGVGFALMVGPAEPTGLGALVAILGCIIIWHGFQIHADDLRADFEERFYGVLSPALQNFAGIFGPLYQKTFDKEWEPSLDDAVFPDRTHWDKALLGFARKVYPEGGSNDPAAIYQRSETAQGVEQQEFEGFHNARRDITRFLQIWAVKTKSRPYLRRYVEGRMMRDSTKRVVKAATYLEIALARALKNPTSPLDPQEWYKWARGWGWDD